MSGIVWRAGIGLGIMTAVATTAAAQQGVPEKPADSPIVISGSQAPEDKKVCRSSVPTGSILPVTVCKSRRAWDLERKEGLASLQHLREFQQMQNYLAERKKNEK